MRWNSDAILDEETRNNVSIQHVKQYQQWLEWLPGWDNFPFKEVKFNVIAWAVANDSKLIGNRDDFHVYTEFKDDDGIVACDPGCSRHLNPDGDYSSCGRGAENRFHQYFLVDKSWGEHNMGSASGEGINVSEYGWDTVGSKLGNWSILVHESVCRLSSPTSSSNKLIFLGSHLWFPGLRQRYEQRDLHLFHHVASSEPHRADGHGTYRPRCSYPQNHEV